MAETKNAKPKSWKQGQEGNLFIVNPSGTVQSVTEKLGREILEGVVVKNQAGQKVRISKPKPGYRAAKQGEIDKYFTQKVQSPSARIAKPVNISVDDVIEGAK